MNLNVVRLVLALAIFVIAFIVILMSGKTLVFSIGGGLIFAILFVALSFSFASRRRKSRKD